MKKETIFNRKFYGNLYHFGELEDMGDFEGYLTDDYN